MTNIKQDSKIGEKNKITKELVSLGYAEKDINYINNLINKKYQEQLLEDFLKENLFKLYKDIYEIKNAKYENKYSNGIEIQIKLKNLYNVLTIFSNIIKENNKEYDKNKILYFNEMEIDRILEYNYYFSFKATFSKFLKSEISFDEFLHFFKILKIYKFDSIKNTINKIFFKYIKSFKFIENIELDTTINLQINDLSELLIIFKKIQLKYCNKFYRKNIDFLIENTPFCNFCLRKLYFEFDDVEKKEIDIKKKKILKLYKNNKNILNIFFKKYNLNEKLLKEKLLKSEYSIFNENINLDLIEINFFIDNLFEIYKIEEFKKIENNYLF